MRNDIELSSFYEELGLQAGDIIKSINGKEYSAQNIYELITTAQSWKAGDPISLVINRNGEEQVIESTIVQPMATGIKLVEVPNANNEQIELRYAWLKS